jgi:hypothetical protein
MHAQRISRQSYGCYGRVVGKNIVEIEDDVGGGKSKTAWKDATTGWIVSQFFFPIPPTLLETPQFRTCCE